MVFVVCISDPKLFFGIISQTKTKKKRDWYGTASVGRMILRDEDVWENEFANRQ